MAGILDIYSPDDIMNDVFPRLSYAPMDNLGYGKAFELAKPYTAMASRYGYGENPSLKQGLGSDVRHTTGSALAKFAMQDYLKNNFGVPTDSSLSDKLSNLGLYTSTGIQEIQDAYKNVRNLTGYGVDFRDALNRGLVQPMEDVTANIRAKNIPYGTPVEEIIKYAVENSPSKYMQAAPQISSLNSFGPQNYETPQEKANNNFLKTLSNLVFTPAGAAEVTPGNVQNKGLDSFNNLVSDTVMAEPNQFQDYPGVENLGGVQNFDLEGVRDIISQMEEEKGNYIERPEDGFNMEGILQSLGGFAKNTAGRYIGSQALGGAGGMLFGPIGGLVGGIIGALKGGDLFNQNTYSQQMYNNLTPGGKAYASSLYGPGGALQGYNQFSAFGKGTLGTIGNILAKNPNMSLARQNAYRTAADKYISGIDPTQQGYNAVTKKGGYGYDDAYINYAPPSGGGKILEAAEGLKDLGSGFDSDQATL
jgi:hypothetical protein